MVTSPALIVQGPMTPRVTARPELATPLTGNGASTRTLLAGTVRLTDCTALMADVDWCASGAGAGDRSPRLRGGQRAGAGAARHRHCRAGVAARAGRGHCDGQP